MQKAAIMSGRWRVLSITRLISLHGQVNGSARITASDSVTVVETVLRGRRGGGLTAHIIAREGIYELSLDEGRGGFPKKLEVRGILITDAAQNGFICEGSCGCSALELGRAKEFVRMQRNASRKAGENVKAARARNSADISGEESGAAGQNMGSAALSPVTQEILSQAQRLFASPPADHNGHSNTAAGRDSAKRRGSPIHAGGGQSGVKGSGLAAQDAQNDTMLKTLTEREQNKEAAGLDIPICENCASADDEAVKNPFPQSFPNSSWRRKKSERGKLTGSAMIRGIKYDIIAVEARGKYPPRGMNGNLRRMRAESGRRYWVKLMPKVTSMQRK